MGRFFKDKVQNKNRNGKLELILIGVGIVVVIFIIAIVYNNFKNKNKNITYKLNDSIYVQTSKDKPELEDYFKEVSSLKGITLDDSELDPEIPGVYQVQLTINGKDEIVMVIVEEESEDISINFNTVQIDEGSNYSVSDFVASCTDSYGKECSFTYYESNETDYSKYTEVGNYTIKIMVIDSNDDEFGPYDATLIINSKQDDTKNESVEPITDCEFGSLDYDTNYYSFPLAYKISNTSNCALDMKKWNDETVSQPASDLFNKDIEKLNGEIENYLTKNKVYTGDAGIDVRHNNIAILNKEGSGLVGYAVIVYVYVWDYNDRTEVNTSTDLKLKYYIDSNGNRTYSTNEYNFN